MKWRNYIIAMLLMFGLLFGGCSDGGGHDDDGGPSGTGGSDTIATTGGTLTTDLADVTVPPDASLRDVTITVTPVDPLSGVPEGLTAIGRAVDVTVTNPDLINAPFIIKIKYSDSGIEDEDNLLVIHYNTTTGRYEPVTILAHDKTANTITIETRSFSSFVLVTFASSLIPTSHSVTNFTPTDNGWNINNFGSYFSPNGNCLGMAAYATWFFDNKTENLNGKYSATGLPSIASLVAQRAHLAQSQYWAKKSSDYLDTLGDAQTARLMKLYMAVFDQPLILLLKTNGSPRHASVVYGYNANGFTFYDVNVRNAVQTVSFDGTTWGTYSGYNGFSFVALPSMGRTEDFAQLTSEAEAGFTTSSLISLTSPTEGQEVASHSANIVGTLSGSLNSSATLLAYVKGVPQTVPVSEGAFNATIPIASGENTITLLAGVDIRNQSNWYANAATLIRTVQGTLTETKLLITLTWNQNNSDVDLYVTEPAASGQTAWYSNMTTSNGLNLDFDNVTGYGPEHITLVTLGGSGTVLAGEYVIRVHYFEDKSTAGQSVSGNVSIVLNEGTPQQVMKNKSFAINTANYANDEPGSTGVDWVDIGTVNLINGTITIY